MANLSKDLKRDLLYNKALVIPKTLSGLVNFGHKLMCQAKLHRHFFGQNSFWGCLMGKSDLLPSAQFLALYALGLPNKYANYANRQLSMTETLKVIQVFEQRISKRIPIEYITNECEYLNNKFYVNNDVLIPRSLMTGYFKTFVSNINWSNCRVLDLCTGSGCIGISIAKLHPKVTVDLVDISDKALNVAKTNITKHQLQARVKCIHSNLFENVTDNYDLIITNPPYVTTKEYELAPLELKREPKIALEAGNKGLDIISKIIMEAKNYLTPNGLLIAEVGFTAAKNLKKIYPKKFTWLPPKAAPETNTFFDRILLRHCILACSVNQL